MHTDTEAIVFKQIKASGGRRMILLFTAKYGKISAGTSLTERNRSKAALALRPFTHGRYELNRMRDQYFLNGAEAIRSHYALGEDVDKYLHASYVMELTEKLLPEEAPAPELFRLLRDFLEMMETRSKAYLALVTAYTAKAIWLCGSGPVVDSCVFCGAKENLTAFSVSNGGAVCENCRQTFSGNERLIYDTEFDIVRVLRYFQEQPFRNFEKLTLDQRLLARLRELLRTWMIRYLDIGELKSESLLSGEK